MVIPLLANQDLTPMPIFVVCVNFRNFSYIQSCAVSNDVGSGFSKQNVAKVSLGIFINI